MSAQWTAEIVGKMHLNNINQTIIAQKLLVSREYVNTILNGKRTPKNAEQKFRSALEEILTERQANS